MSYPEATAPDDENDGVLEAREIATLALNTDLTALSACETGRASMSGTGVVALSWAFLAAGCPTTVVSQYFPSERLRGMESARSHSEPRYLERVDALRAEANAIGVEGIPTFVIGNLGLSGCQPYEVFEQFASQAGARRRT